MNPIRVLVVDDDALQRDLVSRVLSSDRFEVAVASSVEEIPRVVDGFSPDVVLVDVNIPGTASGGAVEVARRSVAASTRIFLFSADDDAVLRTLARRVKADGWLSKSTSVFDLGERLRKFLDR